MIENLSSSPSPSPSSIQQDDNSTNNQNDSTNESEEKEGIKLNDWMTCFCIVNFDLEYGQKLEGMFPPSDLQEKEISNLCFLSFPETTGDIGDTIYTFRLRRQVDPTKSKKKKENSYLFGFVFFRQQKDASISRGYLQKSVLLISPHPNVSLFKKVISVVGPMYFEKGEIVLQAAYRNISAWPQNSIIIETKSKADLPFLGHILDFNPPSTNLRTLSIEGSLDPAFNSHHSLFTVFSVMLNKLWILWELVMLCEPIIVISTSPQKSSDAVLALISLINPISYAGDFRPYFTIHDPDYNTLSDMWRNLEDKGKGTTSTNTASTVTEKTTESQGFILGVTNPIFRKEFAHWPHVILFDEDVKKKSGKPGYKSSGNGLISKYKPLRTIDDETSKQLMKKTPNSSVATAVNNELLRRCMDEVTSRFMAPLIEYYPKSYLPDKKDYHPLKNPPAMSAFKEANFLKYLLKLGIKTKDIELYRRFIRTPNFVSWFRQKKKHGEQEILRTYMNCLDPKKVAPFLQGKSEVELIDYWMRAQERKSSLIKKGELSAESLAKYDHFLEYILSKIPEDIRKNMLVSAKEARRMKNSQLKTMSSGAVSEVEASAPLTENIGMNSVNSDFEV